MISLHEPSWAKVDLGMAVGVIGFVVLVVARRTSRRRPRWGLTEIEIHGPQATSANEMLLALVKASAKRSKRRTIVLSSLGLIAILFGFNFGMKNYRLMCKMAEAEALFYQASSKALDVKRVRDNDNQAVAVYRSAINIDPHAASLHFQLATLLSALNRYQEAIPEYRELLSEEPNNAKGLFDLGTALQKSGRGMEAIQEFQHAVNLDPRNLQAHISLANALVKSKQLEEACREYRSVIHLAPGNVQAHLNLCSALIAMHRSEEGLAEGRKAVEMDPKSPLAHNVMGYDYAALGRYKEAAAEMRRVTQLKPDMAVGYFGLGRAQIRLNQKAEAVQSFKKFLTLSEGRPRYLAARASVQATIAMLQ
jgi:tetratricopeptide (TPR) repeat protein